MVVPMESDGVPSSTSSVTVVSWPPRITFTVRCGRSALAIATRIGCVAGATATGLSLPTLLQLGLFFFKAGAFTFGSGRKIEFLAQAFNLLNAKNLQAQFGSGRVGNSLSPVFGTIVSARPNFQGEIALRATF